MGSVMWILRSSGPRSAFSKNVSWPPPFRGFSADMECRNDSQSIRWFFIKRSLNGTSLWLGYLGLGAGLLYFLLNPQKATSLFSIIGRKISNVLGWMSWRGSRLHVSWTTVKALCLKKWRPGVVYDIYIKEATWMGSSKKYSETENVIVQWKTTKCP